MQKKYGNRYDSGVRTAPPMLPKPAPVIHVPPSQSVQVPMRGSAVIAQAPMMSKPLPPQTVPQQPKQTGSTGVGDVQKSVKQDIINYLNSDTLEPDTKAVLAGLFNMANKVEHQTRVMEDLITVISDLTGVISETSGK